MKKHPFRKAAAAMLAFACIGIIPPAVSVLSSSAPSLTAYASPLVSFDEETGILTVGGNVSKTAVQTQRSNTAITKIQVADDAVFPADCSGLFQQFRSVREIDLTKGNWSNVTNMDSMFSESAALRKITFGGTFNTSKVTDMGFMFYKCQSLEALDLSCFNTANVTDMRGMFYSCSALQELDLKNFDTSNVTSLEGMVQNCVELWLLDLSGFENTKLTDMTQMFTNCTKLTNLYLSGFKTPAVTNMNRLFLNCASLYELDLSSFDTSKVTDMREMFKDCQKLRFITIHEFNKDSLVYDGYMFENCYNIQGGCGSTYDSNKVDSQLAHIDYLPYGPGYFTQRGVMFDAAYGTLYIGGKDFTKEDVWAYRENEYVTKVYAQTGTVLPEDCDYLFGNTSGSGYWKNLGTIDLHEADTSRTTTMGGMFAYNPSIIDVSISNFDTSNVTQMSYMFAGCKFKSKFLDLSFFETPKLKQMYGMFSNVKNLQIIDISGFDTRNVTDMDALFENASDLIYIFAGENFIAPANATDLFTGCRWLIGGNGTRLDYEHIDGEYARFDDPGIKPGYFTRKSFTYDSYSDTVYLEGQIDKSTLVHPSITAKYVVAMEGTILPEDCSNLFQSKNFKTIDLSKADTSKTTNMFKIFAQCRKLESLSINGFNTSNVTNMEKMFQECELLEDLDLSNFDTSHATTMASMFRGCKSITSFDLSSFDTSNVTYMDDMFRDCQSLESIDLGNFDTSNVLTATYMFAGCKLLTSLDLSNFDTQNFLQTTRMFYDCRSLETICVSNKWNMDKVYKSDFMFSNCYNILGENGTFFDANNLDKTFARPDKPGQPGYLTLNPLSDASFSHNVNLSNSIGIVYYFPADLLEGMSDIRLTIQKETFSGNTMKLSTTVIRSYAIETSSYGTEYVFRYNGISAKEMGSKVYAILSGTKNGTEYRTLPDVYSVKQYATNKLGKSSTKAGLKTLLVDMLNYGAQAQQHFGYNTGDLANNALTADQKKLATAFSNSMITNHSATKKLSNATAQFSGKTLNLGNNISIVYFMTFNNTVNKNNVSLKLSYTTATGVKKTETIPFSKFTKGDYEGEYRYDFSSLAAKDSMQPVETVILENNKPVSDTITYSIPSYASKKLSSASTSTSLKEVIRKMIVYYTSAKNYLT